MDNVSSFKCLTFDSKLEVLAKDNGVKNLFLPAMIPLNCDTPIIGSKPEESRHEESRHEESKDEKSETEESEDEESETKESKDEESKDEEIGECKYCLHVGEHISQLCPYKYDAPKNATLDEGCMVVCSICCCLLRDSCCADCDLSIECAVLKDCPICGKQGEHWPSTCSKREGKHIPSAFTCNLDTGFFFLPTNVH